MAGNPLQYTNRTYNSILTDINNDPNLVDKPDFFKRMIAGLGDIFSFMLNGEANNAVLRTAFTRPAVSDLLELIDYYLLEQQTASGQVLFYINSAASFPFTVLKENLIAVTQSSSSISSRRFESRSNVNVTAVSEVITDAEVNTTTDILTVTRAFTTGEKIILAGASLPSPLVAGTEYYVIKVTDTTIKLATTLANAYAGTNIDITTTGSGNITISLYSFFATLYQQETKDQQTIGTSDGTTEFQTFDLPDINVLRDTLVVTINSVTYTIEETLVLSDPTDTHFEIKFNTDLSSKIRFGNGTYGIIPPAFDILVDYAVGGGVISNVGTINALNVYAGTDSNVSGVSNYAAISGGAAEQNIETAKILGPLLLKARDRFVTSEDGEALAIAFSGISLVDILKNEFGVLSAKVIAIALGGGNPSSAVKTALQTYLIDRTILESIDVRVQDSTITSHNVTSAAKMRIGYLYADEEKYFDLAWKLFLTETGKEIYDTFLSTGIADTVTLINSIFSTSFGTSDYDQVQLLVEALSTDSLGYRIFGETLQESDAFAYIAGNVLSIDYMTITAPSFPISNATDEITTPGTLTLTEIP